MTSIYIVSDFGRLVKSGETLQLKKENDILRTIFPFQTEQLVIVGNIDITSAAIRLLMRHRIETIFLSHNGCFNGIIDFQAGKNVFLRKRQYALTDNSEFIMTFASSIVISKLRNQLAFMQRIARKNLHKPLNDAISQMKAMIQRAGDTKNTDSLRGYEGQGARLFFSVFRQAIQPAWAIFNGRSMNPPRDNINAVLSFIYTLILFRVDAAIGLAGLDPYAGYFHKLDYGKKTLAFDLMEEYRTPIADTLTVALFNLGVLTADDFREEIFAQASDDFPLVQGEEIGDAGVSIPVEKKGVLLTKEGIKKVITQFERKLDDKIHFEPEMEPMNYKQIIVEQAKHCKRVIMGEESEYKPLVIK